MDGLDDQRLVQREQFLKQRDTFSFTDEMSIGEAVPRLEILGELRDDLLDLNAASPTNTFDEDSKIFLFSRRESAHSVLLLNAMDRHTYDTPLPQWVSAFPFRVLQLRSYEC